MSDTVRNIGSIAVGYAGYFAGGPLGFAIATVLFNVIVPPKSIDTGSQKGGGTANTSINQGIYQNYGKTVREGGDFLRCPKNADGQRYGIALRKGKKGAAGGSGKVAGAGSSTEKEYLRGSFGIAEGVNYIDKFIVVSSKNGEVVKFDRFGAVTGEVEVVPVYGAVTGQLIADVSETIRFHYGTEEQQVDTAESQWYDGQVSADRGLTKVVFNDYGPLESGTTFKFWLRNSLTGRVSIMKARLKRAGIPDSRVNFRSIPESTNDYGWWVEGPEPARDLAEQVAARSYHDLHFLATNKGMVFTDISRVRPTIITVPREKMGAYINAGGNGSPIPLLAESLQSGEAKPRTLKITCKNKDRNFKDDGVTIQWPQATGEEQTINLRCVAGMDEIYDFGEIVMRELQNAQGVTEVALMPGFAEVCPGVVLDIPDETDEEPTGRKLLRVVSQKIGGVLVNSCSTFDPSVYNAVLSPSVIVEPPPTATDYGVPHAVWMDGVSVTSEMTTQPVNLLGGRVDTGKDWGDASVAITGSEVAALTSPLCSGLLKTAYSYTDDALYKFDYTTTLRIQLDEGQSLVSTDEDSVVSNHANMLWMNGCYLGFTTANAASPTLYDITGLYPGMLGSDAARAFAVNTRVNLITDESGNQDLGVAPVSFATSTINRPLAYTSTSLGNTKLVESGTVICTAANMKVLAVNPSVIVSPLADGGLLIKAFARSRDPESALSYWDSGQKFRHVDPFIYTLELLGATGSTVRLTRTQTFSSAELDFILTPEEKTAVFGAQMPLKVRGRITGENDFGAGFTRAFTSSYYAHY